LFDHDAFMHHSMHVLDAPGSYSRHFAGASGARQLT